MLGMNMIQRWRTVCIILMLLLTIAGAGQTPPAQAASDNPADVYFEVSASPSKPPPLCINQSLQIYVSVNKNITKIIGGTSYNLPRGIVTGGGMIHGIVSNPRIGEFRSDEYHIESSAYGADSLSSGMIVFTFTAKKAGRATLTFTADIPYHLVASNSDEVVPLHTVPAKKAEIPVVVRNCKFKATTIGEWHVPGPANISIVAISEDAEVKTADAQSPFTGSARVNLAVTTSQVGDCIAQSVTTSSQVDWTGDMDDNGLLVMEAKYQTAGISLPVYCVGSDGGVASGSTPVQLTPDPLQVSLASSSGVFRQSQVLQGPEATPGYVTIIVVPEEDEATAFNADGQVALIPSVWRTLLWDNYPWLNNTLLVLR